MVATRQSWKTLPMPDQKGDLAFSGRYLLQEFGTMCQGLIPEQMEDKWFIFYEEPWLYFHRSWTGICVYQLELRKEGDRVVVTESWVNQHPEQYKQTSLSYDQKLLHFLIETMLLKRPSQLPLPAVEEAVQAAYQYHTVGRAYFQAIVDEKTTKLE